MNMKGDGPSIEMGRKVRAVLSTFLAAAVLAATGCGARTGRSSKAAATPTKAGAVTTTDYTLRGTVRSVAPESGRVLIAH